MSNYNEFELIEFNEYKKLNNIIENLYLKDLECKHIANFSVKNNIWIELAKKVDYKWVVFGSHRFMPENERLNFELKRINLMHSSKDSRPIRIVKSSNGKYFVDNTHWALAYIKRYGLNVKLTDVPFYLVDFSNNIPLIVNVNNSVIKNNEDMKNAVNAAGDIEERILLGWRPNEYKYTIEEFLNELLLSNINEQEIKL